MFVTMTNGKPQRKQLSDQLDRLDSIIDALADGLPAAVAAAAREGTRQAVKDAIVEILSNPELRNLIAGMSPPTISPTSPVAPASQASTVSQAARPKNNRPSFWSQAKKRLTNVSRGVLNATAPTVSAVVTRCKSTASTVRTASWILCSVMPVKRIAMVGVGVGLVTAAISYACPPAISAVLTGLAWMSIAVAFQVGVWLKGPARRLGLI